MVQTLKVKSLKYLQGVSQELSSNNCDNVLLFCAGKQTLVDMGLVLVTEGHNTGYMCEEEMIILFNGTFNSTQVLHKAGGIGVEQEAAPFLHIQYDFIRKLITLKH